MLVPPSIDALLTKRPLPSTLADVFYTKTHRYFRISEKNIPKEYTQSGVDSSCLNLALEVLRIDELTEVLRTCKGSKKKLKKMELVEEVEVLLDTHKEVLRKCIGVVSLKPDLVDVLVRIHQYVLGGLGLDPMEGKALLQKNIRRLNYVSKTVGDSSVIDSSRISSNEPLPICQPCWDFCTKSFDLAESILVGKGCVVLLYILR